MSDNFHGTVLIITASFFYLPPTSSHFHPLQAVNCESNSRLVLDEDDNGKFRLHRVKRRKQYCDEWWLSLIALCYWMKLYFVYSRLSIAWFDAYLTNRMQVTDVGGIFSDPRAVPYGVPQGSILGPLLFFIYVNDMEASVSCKLILYADDSDLLVSGKHIQTIENVLGDNLLSLSNWLIDNTLSLHLDKTESILFWTKHMLSKHSKLAIFCGNNVITSKTVIRYLGVDLEQTLSGTAIVENILKKGNSRLKFLCRQATYLTTRSRKLLTSALILCHFGYACSAWYSGLQKTMKLQILQNKTIRFALDLSPRTHLGITHFLKMQWLPVDVGVEQLNLSIMHRIVHGGAPCYLTESLMASQVHDVETRHRTLSASLPSTGRNGSKAFKLNGINHGINCLWK